MKRNCSSKNPLHRDGTSQQQRILKALLPGYIPVDERDIEKLKEFALKYAKEIQYYNRDNQKDGDWTDFFDKEVDSTAYNSPHYTLFVTFLKLFKYAQDEMNKITKKHLDFYYRDVLHLEENPAVPDQVFLIFELAKHVTQKKHLLKKGTQLIAGKDSEGKNLFYGLATDMTLNVASVFEMKAVFSNIYDIHKHLVHDPENHYRLYASPQANSVDGVGGEFVEEDKSWRTFGTVTFPNIRSPGEEQFTADRKQADLGFAIASPNLFLAEGERIITMELTFSSDITFVNAIGNSELDKAFKVMFSGEKEWIEPLTEQTSYIVDGEVDPIVARRIYDFLNAVSTPEQIAGTEPMDGPVFDDLTAGYGNQIRDYDIGLTVAGYILDKRAQLGGRFDSIDQIRSVYGMGEDKINDLAYTFSFPENNTWVDRDNNKIFIRRTITKAQEAIVAYNKENLLDPFDTKWPVVKVLLNQEYPGNPYIYALLKDFLVDAIDLTVDVREVRDLIVQNDQSVLDPGKPFQLFTNRPMVGSNFYIGSWEVFQKSINSLNIDLKWHDLPDDITGFGGYYVNYYPDQPARNNTSFEADIEILEKKAWKAVIPEDDQLFDNLDNETLKAENNLRILTSPNQSTIGDIKRDTELPEIKKFELTTQKGFVKLSLKGMDFGHKDYHISYTRAILFNMGATLNPQVQDYTGMLPNEPYTPALQELSLDYVATEHIPVQKVPDEDYEDRVEQFYHVHPFGVGEVDTRNKKNHLVAQYLEEGSLYVGLKDVNPPENLSLLIQILEGSSDPDLLPPEVTWSYLTDNEWEVFPVTNILSDTTKGLITTGVILFDIPAAATNENTILTKGLYWLKASVARDSRAIPNLIDIKAQAVPAIFEDNDNAPDHLNTPLPQGTISKLVKADSAVKTIKQPYTSFAGQVKEESSEFYTRVSERLRHKKRAITIWDYEHIILQKFNTIYKVKCLNHTRFEGTFSTISEAAPGNVSLIVISNVRNRNAVDLLKPRTSLSLINEIQEFLAKIKSPYVNLFVNNPVYEEIMVDFNVKFHQGYDKGLYETILINAIKQYLSPWAYDIGSDLVFGGKIHKSMVLNFVEQQDYVDFITCFKMFHIVPDDPDNDPLRDVDEAEAFSSASVLGSADTHKIHILESDACECDDNVVLTTEIASADECNCD